MTRGDFETKIDLIAQFQLDIARLAVERNEAKEAILLNFNTQIAGLKDEIERLQSEALPYAKLNWKSLAPTPKAKTAETPLACYGFRTGQPSPKSLTKPRQTLLWRCQSSVASQASCSR